MTDSVEREINLVRARERDGKLIVPVEVSSALGLKAFGIELAYSSEKLKFVGVLRTELTKDFVTVAGNEVRKGAARIGGYSASGIQEIYGGTLVELVFEELESGGKIKIVRLEDDLSGSRVIR